MKRIAIVGMGLGAATITGEAREAVLRAEVLLGAPAVLEQAGAPLKKSYPCYLPKDVAAAVAGERAREFAVLVSGDVGFYSAAAGLCEALGAYGLRFVPGVSTVNAFFARLKLPWQNAAFASMHGRTMNIADTVRRNRLTYCLSGNNVKEIGAALCKAGLGHVKTHTGENLGTETERIRETAAEALLRGSFPPLTVLLFVNEAFDDGIPCGLPDGCFSRLADIPMTKSETRALVLSKLGLRPDFVCWDVGAGSGSVTVEMALSAYRGHVYAVERRQYAISLIEQNCASFHVGNVTALCGEAPAALEALPAPNAVFIGGSGGELAGIVDVALRKNPRARVVVTAVTLETASAALAAFSKAGMDAEVIQLNLARGRQAGKLHRMEAQNPVSILSAGGQP